MSLSKFNKMKRIEIFKIHFLNVTKSTIKNNTVLMICKQSITQETIFLLKLVETSQVESKIHLYNPQSTERRELETFAITI